MYIWDHLSHFETLRLETLPSQGARLVHTYGPYSRETEEDAWRKQWTY